MSRLYHCHSPSLRELQNLADTGFLETISLVAGLMADVDRESMVQLSVYADSVVLRRAVESS